MKVLVTGDENANQQLGIPVPGRPTPVVCQAVDPGSIGGSVPVLPRVWYVAKTAPAAGDGSIAAPFNTFAAAAAAAGALDTINVAPGDYSAEPAVDPGQSIVVRGLGVAGSVVLPPLAPTAGDLAIENATVDYQGDDGSATLTLRDCLTTSSAEGCQTSFVVSGGTLTGNVGNVEADAVSFADVLSCGVAAGHMTFRECVFGAVTLTFSSTPGTINMDRVSELNAATAGVLPSVLPTPLEGVRPEYGSGSDGAVVLAAGLTLSESVEYSNLAIAAGGQLRCAPSILRVRNLLDLSACPSSGIIDIVGGTGGNAALAVPGTSWGGTGGFSQGTFGTLAAPAGAAGGAGAGAQAVAAPVQDSALGGSGGGSGAGGAGFGGAGGAARAAATPTQAQSPVAYRPVFSGPSAAGTAVVPVVGGGPGQGGSAGGGSGVDGGGGGGGARPGGIVVIYARGLRSSPNIRAINARGSNAGNGGNGSPAGACGGGGGAGGGGGGAVVVFWEWRIGSAGHAAMVDCTAGDGGSGGNGTGGQPGGDGGGGGQGGQIVFINTLTGARSVKLGDPGTGGSAAAGAAGGAGGFGGSCQTTF